MGELTIILFIALFSLTAIYTIIDSAVQGEEHWDLYVDTRTGEIKKKVRRVVR
jgi:hypothetical protein